MHKYLTMRTLAPDYFSNRPINPLTETRTRDMLAFKKWLLRLHARSGHFSFPGCNAGHSLDASPTHPLISLLQDTLPMTTPSRAATPHHRPLPPTWTSGPTTAEPEPDGPDDPGLVGLQVFGYLLHFQTRQLPEATLRSYTEHLLGFAGFLTRQGISNLRQLRPSHIDAYLTSLRTGDGRPDRAMAAARAIRALCTFFAGEEATVATPLPSEHRPGWLPTPAPVFAADDVCRLLAAAADARDAALVLVLLDAGCRAAELVALNVGDVNLATGELRIHSDRPGRNRVVWLGTRSRRQLQRYLDERRQHDGDEPIWLERAKNTRLSTAGLSGLLYRLGRQAGVADCHVRTFRRSCACWALSHATASFDQQPEWGPWVRAYLVHMAAAEAAADRYHGVVDLVLGSV